MVEVHEPRAHRPDQLALDVLAGILEELFEQVAQALEVAGALGGADAEQQALGGGDHAAGVGAALVGGLGDLAGRLNQPPVERVAGDDARVRLDTGGAEVPADEVGEVGLAAEGIESARAFQFVREGGQRDRLAAIGQGDAGLVAPAVLLAEEVLRAQQREHTRVAVGVEEQGRDDGLLGGDVMRR